MTERTYTGPCVFGDGWADPAVIVESSPGLSGPGWVKYAHPGCAERARWAAGDEWGQEPIRVAVPPLPRREPRARHRHPRRVLDDLPAYMPGALVAAYGLARRHAAALAIVVLVWPLPVWLVAPQAADGLAADDRGRSTPEWL